MNKPLVQAWAVAAVLLAVGVVVAIQFVQPAPPDRIVLATGSSQGAYHAFGQRLARRVAASGVEIELRNTAGSEENLQLLTSGEVDAALVQGGLGAADETIRALASLYYEPLWIFYRGPSAPSDLRELAGLRFSAGVEGSGTRRLVRELLELNGVEAEPRSLDAASAREALGTGELDAGLFVAGESAPYIQQMLRDPQLDLVNLRRAKAYPLHQRYLSAVFLPEAAADLSQGLPRQDTHLLAVTAMLAVRDDFHPALVDLLLMSSRQVLNAPGLFHQAGDFPSPGGLSLPLDDEAERFHRRGPSLLQRFLPFWAATLIDRLVVMVLPLLALLIPLGKAFPPLYRWRVRSRIYRWYKDLKAIEYDLGESSGSPEQLLERIDRLVAEVEHVETPLSYSDELYHLRSHIELVRARIAGD
ncbi:MAG: TAXI family TRAP transporter solute-binding subunit [Xanthomonadales bacterium]|nr:TAXI family TRAP transporter solute-binding subunit [Xanthomonadales bacterium]